MPTTNFSRSNAQWRATAANKAQNRRPKCAHADKDQSGRAQLHDFPTQLVPMPPPD
jgi:hypothetical protein